MPPCSVTRPACTCVTSRTLRIAQALARSLDTRWAGVCTEGPHGELDASLIFAPDGGLMVCGGIHMSTIAVQALREGRLEGAAVLVP